MSLKNKELNLNKNIELIFSGFNNAPFIYTDENENDNNIENSDNLDYFFLNNNKYDNNEDNIDSESILNFLKNKINLMNSFKISLQNSKKSRANKIINIINDIINLLKDLIQILNSNNISLVNSEDFFSNLFYQPEDKYKYHKYGEQFKEEICYSKRVFSSSNLSETVYISKKNINNWIRNGYQKKTGYGRKKILLPLRIEFRNFLTKEKLKGRKRFKKKEIFEIINELANRLINDKKIEQESFQHFKLSNSWIKSVKREIQIQI